MAASTELPSGMPALAGRTISVGVIGDFQPEFPPHPATNVALEHAAAALSITVDVRWLSTTTLCDIAKEELAQHDALWCAPGKPLSKPERNILGIEEAQHAEYDPYASELFISALSCSPAGRTMSVRLTAGSLAGDCYGQREVREQYYCNFGLNPAHQARLEGVGLEVVGTDQDGEARVIELPDQRFYLATLFVPQLNSQADSPHPLVIAFLKAAAQPVENRSGRLSQTS